MEFRTTFQTKDKFEYFVATLITASNSAGTLQWGFLRQSIRSNILWPPWSPALIVPDIYSGASSDKG